MSDYAPEDKLDALDAKRAMAKAKGSGFNPGYKLEFSDKEACEARAMRDSILRELAECMDCGLPPDAERALALVERYRFDFIDQYLYRSTPVIMLGLASTIAALPENRRAYDAYAPGLAEYLAQAFRAYYYSLPGK